jgi:hypothetical protein
MIMMKFQVIIQIIIIVWLMSGANTTSPSVFFHKINGKKREALLLTMTMKVSVGLSVTSKGSGIGRNSYSNNTNLL